jgi:hypothetical protein
MKSAFALFALLPFAMSGDGAAGASQTGMPLFAAFKTFCVATNANPEAMKVAVDEAGGKPSKHPGGYSNDPPGRFAFWDVTVQGHSLQVSGVHAYLWSSQTTHGFPTSTSAPSSASRTKTQA